MTSCIVERFGGLLSYTKVLKLAIEKLAKNFFPVTFFDQGLNFYKYS